ncbi:MAG: hypothetical protein ACKO3P_16965 [Planctomycetaceae bacterium]
MKVAVALGEKYRDYLVREFVRYYHRDRPHQGVSNVTLDHPATDEPVLAKISDVVCDERLGGLLKSYRRAA